MANLAVVRFHPALVIPSRCLGCGQVTENLVQNAYEIGVPGRGLIDMHQVRVIRAPCRLCRRCARWGAASVGFWAVVGAMLGCVLVMPLVALGAPESLEGIGLVIGGLAAAIAVLACRHEVLITAVEADGVVEFRGIHPATLRELSEMAAAQAARAA